MNKNITSVSHIGLDVNLERRLEKYCQNNGFQISEINSESICFINLASEHGDLYCSAYLKKFKNTFFVTIGEASKINDYHIQLPTTFTEKDFLQALSVSNAPVVKNKIVKPTRRVKPKATLGKGEFILKNSFQQCLKTLYSVAKKNQKNYILHTKHATVHYYYRSHTVFIDYEAGYSIKKVCTSNGCKNSQLEVINYKNDSARFKDEADRRCADQLLWDASIYSSSGKLPVGTDTTKVFTLKHWPNFTRLLLTKRALELVSLWIETPLSIDETAMITKIPVRHINSLYNALASTDILKVEKEEPVKQVANNKTKLKLVSSNKKDEVVKLRETKPKETRVIDDESIMIKKSFVNKLIAHLTGEFQIAEEAQRRSEQVQ